MLKTLKAQVEDCLKFYPATRDSDVALTILIWRRFYPEKLKELDGKTFVATDDLFILPREDNVKRVRAHFQNTLGLYLPTTWEVARQRGINEDKWRRALGYANNDRVIDLR